MKTIKKFIKDSFIFRNLVLLLYVMILTYSISDSESLKPAIISGGIFVLVVIVLWLLIQYNKTFKNFFSK